MKLNETDRITKLSQNHKAQMTTDNNRSFKESSTTQKKSFSLVIQNFILS